MFVDFFGLAAKNRFQMVFPWGMDVADDTRTDGHSNKGTLDGVGFVRKSV